MAEIAVKAKKKRPLFKIKRCYSPKLKQLIYKLQKALKFCINYRRFKLPYTKPKIHENETDIQVLICCKEYLQKMRKLNLELPQLNGCMNGLIYSLLATSSKLRYLSMKAPVTSEIQMRGLFSRVSLCSQLRYIKISETNYNRQNTYMQSMSISLEYDFLFHGLHLLPSLKSLVLKLGEIRLNSVDCVCECLIKTTLETLSLGNIPPEVAHQLQTACDKNPNLRETHFYQGNVEHNGFDMVIDRLERGMMQVFTVDEQLFRGNIDSDPQFIHLISALSKNNTIRTINISGLIGPQPINKILWAVAGKKCTEELSIPIQHDSVYLTLATYLTSSSLRKLTIHQIREGVGKFDVIKCLEDISNLVYLKLLWNFSNNSMKYLTQLLEENRFPNLRDFVWCGMNPLPINFKDPEYPLTSTLSEFFLTLSKLPKLHSLHLLDNLYPGLHLLPEERSDNNWGKLMGIISTGIGCILSNSKSIKEMIIDMDLMNGFQLVLLKIRHCTQLETLVLNTITYKNITIWKQLSENISTCRGMKKLIFNKGIILGEGTFKPKLTALNSTILLFLDLQKVLNDMPKLQIIELKGHEFNYDAFYALAKAIRGSKYLRKLVIDVKMENIPREFMNAIMKSRSIRELELGKIPDLLDVQNVVNSAVRSRTLTSFICTSDQYYLNSEDMNRFLKFIPLIRCPIHIIFRYYISHFDTTKFTNLLANKSFFLRFMPVQCPEKANDLDPTKPRGLY